MIFALSKRRAKRGADGARYSPAKICRGRRGIGIAHANRPNSYKPVHFVAIIRIPCHSGAHVRQCIIAPATGICQ